MKEDGWFLLLSGWTYDEKGVLNSLSFLPIPVLKSPEFKDGIWKFYSSRDISQVCLWRGSRVDFKLPEFSQTIYYFTETPGKINSVSLYFYPTKKEALQNEGRVRERVLQEIKDKYSEHIEYLESLEL